MTDNSKRHRQKINKKLQQQ